MNNPYHSLPDSSFWRRGVADVPLEAFDPITQIPFRIGLEDRIATAGSCFAQHISRTLAKEGFAYLVTETGPVSKDAADENYGVYPARFGNIYTIRQLLQLFERAYGLFEPRDNFWKRADGAFVDPFRPQIQKEGFGTLAALAADRASHLAAVREMFENCDVFVFTLGLTEGWLNKKDGAVFPVAPGVVAAGENDSDYAFENFSVAGMVDDLSAFIRKLRVLNPNVRILLTVSPVPLIATYEPRHVLLSTIYSKSALRVAAQMVCDDFEKIAYFPSYEIIVGPQARGRYYAEDLREVTPDGVAHVMSLFKRHYLTNDPGMQLQSSDAKNSSMSAADIKRFGEEYQVICDEEILDD